jgi:hypothetical protein
VDLEMILLPAGVRAGAALRNYHGHKWPDTHPHFAACATCFRIREFLT